MRTLYSFSRVHVVFAVVALIAVQILVLLYYGQPPICTCGYIKLWEGVVLSPGNSQHLSDWYTFSHIIHGFIFYGALTLLMPKVPVRVRLVLALGVEIGWELVENLPVVIAHYREQALAAGYTGDSIINSVSDSFAMLTGFVLAARLPAWSIVAAALVLELFVGYVIHDNLTLNVLNLIHQFPAVVNWQAGS